MASDLDLKLTVSLDKDAIVNSYIKGLKEAQREADKQTVTYILKPDKTSFLNEMKNMLTSTPDLDKEVKILLDDSSFQKGLNDIEKYAGKKAKGITTAFQKEFQKEFKNENDPLFLNNILGLGQNENKSIPRVKKKIAEITQELSKFSNYTQDKKTGQIKINSLDLDKVSNYKDLERVVELTKQLDAILKQTNTKDYKVDLSNRKDLEESVNKLQSGYSKAMVQYRDDYKSQLESMKIDTEKMFSQLTEMFSNVMLGAIKKMEQAGQEMKDSFDKATEGIGESISNEINEGVEASKKHLKDLEHELDEVQSKKKELGKSDKATQEKLYTDVIKAKRVINDSLKRGDKVSEKDAQAYIGAMTRLTSGVASIKNNPKFETEKQDYEAVRGELGDQYIPISKMQTRIDLINEANNKEATLIKQIDEEKKKIEQSNKERAKTKDIKDKDDKQQEGSDNKKQDENQSKTNQNQEEPTETKIVVNEEEVLESIKKIKDSLQELPEKKTIEINIETQNPDEIQNIVSNWNNTDEASNFDIEVKTKLAPNTSTDIQNQINDIEPKPVVEVKAEIKPSDEIITDDLLQEPKIIDPTLLSESTKYVDELKQGLIELGGMTQGLNFGKEFGGKAGEKEVEKWTNSINELLQKYPQLTKFRDVFQDSDESMNFINSNEWNDFLATLPQARTYLESIGYDFKKIDQVELSSQNEVKSLEDLRDILTEIRRLVNEKTQAFSYEETKVNSVVDNEVTKLDELKGKVESIINDINTAIEKLHDPEKMELTFSPNLSKDFETKIQDLINSKTFEIQLTPQLSNNTNTNDLDNTIESEYLEEISEDSKKLSKEEKKFDDVIKNALKEYLNGAPASTNARKYAKEALKRQVARNQIDSEELFDILKIDPTYSSSQVGGNYMKIKSYLRNSKIKYSDFDRAEFGDNWQMVVDTIGQRNFSKTKGLDPEVLLKEIEKKYGEISSEGVNNTQDALRRIFEYIKKTPEEYAKRLEQRISSYKEQQMEEDDEKLRKATKNAVIPKSYLGEITADSSEELDRINARYAAEQEKLNAETEKQIELYYQEAQAAREDAKSQEELNKSKISPSQDFSGQNPIKENETKNTNIDEEKVKLNELADFIKTEIPNAIEIKNKAFDEEKTHVDEIVNAEKSKLNELANFIKTEIPNAIAEKNAAFDEDKDNVDKAINGEKEKLTTEQDSSSKEEYQEESEKLNNVKDAAIDAGEAKKFFAKENREVLTSIIESLSALNSEGEGFKHLNNIINKLSNEDKTNQLVENLKKIRDELTQPISNDSIINAIRDIAQQGDNLKDLAKVLQATQDQINKAKNTVRNNNKPQVNPIASDKKDVQSTQWNQTYDAHGNITRDTRTFKERNEMGRTTEYTERRNPQTGELSYEIKEHTDYEKVISKTTDAIIRQAKAYHDLTLEMEKSNPDTDKLEALAREYDDCQRVINEATAAVVRFDGQTEHHHNDPATGSKFSYVQDFEQHVQNRTAYGLAKEDARYADYVAKRRENLNRQVDKDLFTAQFELDNGNHTDAFNDRLRDIIDNLRTIQDIVRNNPEAITEREVELARQYSEELKRANKEGKLSANKEANEKSVAKGLARINKILSENTKLAFKSTDVYRELISLQDEYNNFNTSRPQSELNDLNTALEKSISKFDGLSNVFKGKNFFETFLDHLRSTTAQLITQYLSFQDIIRYIRTLSTTIIDLDTQLVDLRKTTTMSIKDLEEFYYASSNIGKQLGVTTSEVIQQASAWSRLGYSTKEASIEMAQLSSKFASISPGMTTDNSTDYLVSTMQAYGIAVDEVERKILDNVNKIGNTFATTNAEIGEMLTRSSAAMKAANNSLEETIALESAAVEVTRMKLCA